MKGLHADPLVLAVRAYVVHIARKAGVAIGGDPSIAEERLSVGRYCQELWISDPCDQAASFRSSSLFPSCCTPSTKRTPARTNGRRWAPLRRRHRRCAMSRRL